MPTQPRALKIYPKVNIHGRERMTERNVSDLQAATAIANPLYTEPIKTDDKGKRAQKIIGYGATVVINPDTGDIITAYKTSKDKIRKYKKGGKNGT